MAKCARQVIKDNGMSDKIKVVPKRSTELTVGPGNVQTFSKVQNKTVRFELAGCIFSRAMLSD